MSAKAKAKVKVVGFGEGRKSGVAGPEAVYIERAVTRWRLRGDGYLRK